MLVDIEILSVQQFISGVANNALADCVGSTHFDAGTVQPDGSVAYNLENLWLRYKLRIPRRLKSFSWRANYGLALNGPEYVRGQVFGWSFGTKDAPGKQHNFKWDVENKTSGLITSETELDRGTAWFWLTYNYAGQNNCYVKNVELATLQGESVGSARVWQGGAVKEGSVYAALGGKMKEGQIYVCRGGIWRPGV